jgi:hypothetical protein
MDLADRTESELQDLYVLKYGPATGPAPFFAIPSAEDLQCPIRREFAFRQMMRQQGPIASKLQTAEMEINKVRQDLHNLVQQLNAKQSVLQHPYNPAIASTSNQSTPYPTSYFTPIAL